MDALGTKIYGFGTKIDLVYTHENYYKTLSIDFFASLKTYGQTELEYTLDYDATKTFLGYRFDHLPTHEFSVEGSPSESINFNLNLTFGKDLSVNEIIPQVGKLKSYFIKLNYQINNKELKDKDKTKEFIKNAQKMVKK